MLWFPMVRFLSFLSSSEADIDHSLTGLLSGDSMAELAKLPIDRIVVRPSSPSSLSHSPS
jgi:hypothetical protein